ncbi:MAG TPA: cell wall-binding repeat-containing protein, partial [Coriobacteriia bacterium]|nr:cell wall-binding repeat-containing protein [Coriobacteriia bacterium]
MSSRRFRRALTAVLVLVLAITVPVSGAIAKVVPPEGFYTASRIDLLGHVGSSVNGTFVDGDRLYVAGAIGLEVYDITTPLSPVKLGECLIATGQPSQVVADASHAYVLTSSAAVVAIDVGDPTEPTAVGTLLAVTGSPQTHDGLALSGSTVFVAGYNEIVPVDVTDPEAMTAGVAFLTGDLGGSWYIDVDGDRLAAVSGANVALVDIATPSAPIVLSVTPFTDLNPGGVDLVWPHLFLGSFNSAVYGLSAFDFSSGAAVLVDSYTNGSWYFESVAVDGGGIAHASFYDGSIITLDVTDPSDIAYESHLDFQTSGNPSDMAIDDSGSVAYIGDSSRGLFTFDVSTPTAITQGPVFRALRSAADVVVSGGMAVVADQTYGVQVCDVTDLADPLFVTGVPLPYASGLAIVGDLLLVNRSPGGGQFSVLDITNPAAPAVTDSLAIPSSSYSDDVAGSEDRAYVVAGGTLKVIDISDPSDISEVGSWSGTFEYSALDVVGTVAVVGATSGSVELLDISADTPVSVGGGVGAWDMVNEVLIDGDVCYVATNGTAGGYGLLQLPISEWGLGGIQYYGFPSQYVTITDMAITEDGYLCMGGPDGIKVFDLPITMTGPPVVASYAPLFNGRGLALNGDGIVTTTLYDGLFTFNGPDFTGPSITVTGVSDGGSYDGPVTPSVTFGADAIDSSVELDGSAWTPATISDPGAYLLEAWAEDHWGNSATDAKEFVILTGPEARLAGTDRYATSAQISESTFKSASTVVLATGRNFPDALAAAPLAYQLDGPVLLVNEGVVPDAILDEIERLGATSAYIVGGTTAVP